jgi:glutathione S-transferase
MRPSPALPTRIDSFKAMGRNCMKVWDETLGRQRYGAGGEISIADLAL